MGKPVTCTLTGGRSRGDSHVGVTLVCRDITADLLLCGNIHFSTCPLNLATQPFYYRKLVLE